MRKVPLRKLSISKTPEANRADKQKEAQERYFLNIVRNNPRYRMIVAHLAQGAKPPVIAAHFAEQGWINVTERTFTEAIRAYRRIAVEEIRTVQNEGLDALIDPNIPQNDVSVKMHQLLNAQFKRIAINMTHELEMGVALSSTSKDVEIANKILETIAKMEGKLQDGQPRRKGEIDTTPDVNENLTALRKTEGSYNRLHGLTRQLVKGPS